MKVLIIEDEKLSAEYLERMIQKVDDSIQICGKYDSVKKSVQFLKNEPEIDLIFLDIHLADGLSFDIFREVEISIPIIFTTAYDNYALKAFEVNSIDYLLKPIGKDELKRAIDKYKNLEKSKTNSYLNQLLPILNQNQIKNFKTRFLVKNGEQIQSIEATEISHFVSDEGFVFLYSAKGKKFIVDYSLEQINELLDPNKFFRINRKTILNIDFIQKISNYFNSRLKVQIAFLDEEASVVSRDRVIDFKQFLDQ